MVPNANPEFEVVASAKPIIYNEENSKRELNNNLIVSQSIKKA